MKLTEVPMRFGRGGGCDSDVVSSKREVSNNKPQFRPAIDDTKPLLQDPVLCFSNFTTHLFFIPKSVFGF